MTAKKRTEPAAEAFAEEFRDILNANLKLIKKLEDENKVLLHDLNERKKELKGIYDIEKVVDRYASLKEILQGIADIIPPAYQYPEVTSARIIISGSEYRTKNFRKTEWRQANEIMVAGKPEGFIEVCYTEERPESDEGRFYMKSGHS